MSSLKLKVIYRLIRERPYHLWKYASETIGFCLNYMLLGMQKRIRSNVIVGANPRVLSMNVFRAERPDAVINIGNNIIIYGNSVILVTGQGCVNIGNDCVIGSNFQLYCKERIVLGNAVLISWNVHIADYDGHPVDPERRYQEMLYMQQNFFPSFNHRKGTELRPDFQPEYVTAPVIIDDNVWIGANAMILKGVHIGAGSVVGAGSIVTRDVPPGCVVAGNPACVIRKLDSE